MAKGHEKNGACLAVMPALEGGEAPPFTSYPKQGSESNKDPGHVMSRMCDLRSAMNGDEAARPKSMFLGQGRDIQLHHA